MASTAPAQKEDRVVFSSGPKNYSVHDVIDAAHFRGDLEPQWRELQRRVEATRKGHASDSELNDADLDEAAIAFRYQYDLITAEETEAWLEQRGLNLSDFSEYFAREQWGRNFAVKMKLDEVAYAGSQPELRDLLTVDLTMSGELERMATRLAWRAAAVAAETPSVDAVERERKDFCECFGLSEDKIPHWYRGLERDQAWFDEMMAFEAAYHERREKLLTAETRQRELGALRLPLTRFKVEMIELESRHAANEAFMCVRDDGMAMADVAREGRYPFHETEMVLEQISEDLQQRFLSLTPGSVLEPMPREDGFLLTRILDKKEPKLDDPDVQQRVDRRILERHFADLASGRIKWSLLSTSPGE